MSPASERARNGWWRCATAMAATLIAASAFVIAAPPPPVEAVTTGNGSLVYSPAAGTSFNPEGGRAAGTTYAKIIVLAHNGTANGQQLVTFDQLVLENGVQVYPIHRSTNNGTNWNRVSQIIPSNDFPGWTRTAQPFLYELPQSTGGLAAGTILFSGMIMPADRSASRLVLYKSTDRGTTWSLISTIDQGGPAVYDPSPSSTTTTVWEPSIIVDGQGGLAVYYSDERQKANGVLQAISYRRSTNGGASWGPLVNVSAPPNQSDRPGMITVTKLPDGRYMASFEVVNRPSQSLNTAPVYVKFSPDGLAWGPESSIGTAVTLADGTGIGSSPYVTWMPGGGPRGTVVIASKWALTPAGQIDGGQNFFVNYNLGEGPWERLPFPVTYDASDTQGGTFSGFAQGLAVGTDGRTIYQATNVENLVTTYNDIRVGSIRLDAQQYEAERAQRTSDTSLVTDRDASNGQKVGNINTASSSVTFTVRAPAAGTYSLLIRYANGTGSTSSHGVSVNSAAPSTVSYAPTVDWGRYRFASASVSLNAGANTIRFTRIAGFAEIDAIHLVSTGAMDPQFRLTNRASGKIAEIAGASLADGAPAVQWGDTNNATQVWGLRPAGSTFEFRNANSGKLLEIPAASTVDGTDAVQWGPTGSATQRWNAVRVGAFWTFTNANSGKVLEVTGASTADGAALQQWPSTGGTNQQWRLSREGIH